MSYCGTKLLLKSLWRDERGVTDVAAYVLVVTIFGVGIIVGLATLRDDIVQGMGDIATSLGRLDQSYSFTSGTRTSVYVDNNVVADDVEGESPACISVTQPATSEE